jgi:hypothetical protein
MPNHPHWYVTRYQAPELVTRVWAAIAAEGARASWSGRAYRHLHVGEFRYWYVPPVLNRALLAPR